MNNYLKNITLASVIFISSNSTMYAEESSKDWYVSPMVSYIKADNDRLADDDFGFMLGLGKQINQNWNVEISAVIDSLDFESASGGYKQRGLMVDGLYFFDRETVMQTYGIVGAGIMSTDIGATDSNNAMLNIGVGMMQQISDSGTKFRADIRYRLDMDDSSLVTEDKFNDLVLNIGFTIPFGDSTNNRSANTKVKPVNSKMTDIDSDNDGVVDSKDQCSNTSTGVKVDNNGCPSAVKSVAEEKLLVSKAVDSDQDGITDNEDKCPMTAVAVKVDSTGCELEDSFVLKNVNFVSGSAVLEVESKNNLNDVVVILSKYTDINVEIAGYTDNRGNVDFNQRLSQKRAESVTAYLVSQGIDSTRMQAKGYGIESPIADNNTSQGRSNNRRVELHLIK